MSEKIQCYVDLLRKHPGRQFFDWDLAAAYGQPYRHVDPETGNLKGFFKKGDKTFKKALTIEPKLKRIIDENGRARTWYPSEKAEHIATLGVTAHPPEVADAFRLSIRTEARADVYEVIDGEREYQRKRGIETDGEPHDDKPLESFVLYMEDYLHELRWQLSRIWTTNGEPPPEALHTLRKVTALGVAAMERHGAVPRE